MQHSTDLYPIGTVKRRVIDYATKQFFEKGIRDVTMDSISQGLKMSKRTLYQLFSDKEQLIIACVEMGVEQARKLKDAMLTEHCDTLEIILKLVEMRLQLYSTMSERYVLDVEHYPAVKAYFEKFRDEYVAESLVFFEKCMNEGTFRADINPMIVSRSSFINNFAIAGSHDFDEFTLNDIILNTAIIQLRGCCTNKGIAVLDRFLEKYHKENHTMRKNEE